MAKGLMSKLMRSVGDRAFTLIISLVDLAGWGNIRYPRTAWRELGSLQLPEHDDTRRLLL